MGAFEPDAVAFFSAATSEPFFGADDALEAGRRRRGRVDGVELDGVDGAERHEGSPSRSRRSPRVPEVRSSSNVSPAARSGCQGERPAAGAATTQRSPVLDDRGRARRTPTGTSPGSVHAHREVGRWRGPVARDVAGGDRHRARRRGRRCAVAKSFAMASSANGTAVRSLAIQPATYAATAARGRGVAARPPAGATTGRRRPPTASTRTAATTRATAGPHGPSQPRLPVPSVLSAGGPTVVRSCAHRAHGASCPAQRPRADLGP